MKQLDTSLKFGWISILTAICGFITLTAVANAPLLKTRNKITGLATCKNAHPVSISQNAISSSELILLSRGDPFSEVGDYANTS